MNRSVTLLVMLLLAALGILCSGPNGCDGGSPDQAQLTLNISGSGSVTVNPPNVTYYASQSPVTLSFAVGDVCTLTAVPDAGWWFDLWEGDLTGNINPSTLSMSSDRNVTAVFSSGVVTDEHAPGVWTGSLRAEYREDSDTVIACIDPNDVHWWFTRSFHHSQVNVVDLGPSTDFNYAEAVSGTMTVSYQDQWHSVEEWEVSCDSGAGTARDDHSVIDFKTESQTLTLGPGDVLINIWIMFGGTGMPGGELGMDSLYPAVDTTFPVQISPRIAAKLFNGEAGESEQLDSGCGDTTKPPENNWNAASNDVEEDFLYFIADGTCTAHPDGSCDCDLQYTDTHDDPLGPMGGIGCDQDQQPVHVTVTVELHLTRQPQ